MTNSIDVIMQISLDLRKAVLYPYLQLHTITILISYLKDLKVILFQGNTYGAGGGVAFREHDVSPQDLAYQGWEYRNKKGGEDIKAEEP